MADDLTGDLSLDETKSPEDVDNENESPEEDDEKKLPEDTAAKEEEEEEKESIKPDPEEVAKVYEKNPNVRVTKSGTIMWEPLCTCPSRKFNCVEDPNIRNPEKNTKLLFADGEQCKKEEDEEKEKEKEKK